MIRQSLARRAHGERLLDNPAYVTERVHWIVDVNARGALLSLTPTGHPHRTPKDEFQELPIPRRRPRAGLQVLPDVLVDQGLYVFGLGDPWIADQRERLEACAQAMLLETIKLARATRDPAVQAQALATARVLDAPEMLSAAWLSAGEGHIEVAQGGRARIKVPRRWAPHHLFAFRFEGEWVAQRPIVREWLAEQAGPEAETSLEETANCA